MNKAYGLDRDAKEMEPTEKLAIMKNDLFGSRNVSFWAVKTGLVLNNCIVIIFYKSCVVSEPKHMQIPFSGYFEIPYAYLYAKNDATIE